MTRAVRLLLAALAVTPVSATALVVSLFVINGYLLAPNPQHNIGTEASVLVWALSNPLIWFVTSSIALVAYAITKGIVGRSLSKFALAGTFVGGALGAALYVVLPPRGTSPTSFGGLPILAKEAAGFGLAGLAAGAVFWTIRRPDRDRTTQTP